MKRMLKGIISLAIVLSICVLPVNAAEGPYTVENNNWGGADGMILNCYTTGIVDSGTQVSTWTKTGNPSQKWFIYSEAGGKQSLRPQANTSLALNANRSAIGTTANVLTASTNNPLDYRITSNMHKTPGNFKIILPARYNHTAPVYLTAHGPKAMCTWQYYNGNTDWIAGNY